MKEASHKEPNSSEAVEVANTAFFSLIALSWLIEMGDHEAGTELFRLAESAINTLNSLCERKPEVFSGIAANQITWPAMHSLHPGLVRKNNALLTSLKLASNTDLNISKIGKAFSFDTPATRIALDHYRLASALRRAPMKEWNIDEWVIACTVCNCRNSDRWRAWETWGQQGTGKGLPRLARNTTLQWKKAFPEFFRLVHGKDFDQCAKLKDLRDSVFQSAKDGNNKVGGAVPSGSECFRP